MRDRTLAKIVRVADRGLASAANRNLRSGDHHDIIGPKLRSASAEAAAALSRQGRYTNVAENPRVNEVRISEHERFAHDRSRWHASWRGGPLRHKPQPMVRERHGRRADPR